MTEERLLPGSDEAERVRRAQRGDRQAFEALVRAHQARVRLQLQRLTRGDAARADDLAQEAFVQAWRQLPHFRGDARLSTWLHRIALNAYLMDRRRRREEPLADPDDLPERAAVVGDPGLRLDVDRAVARLPEAERLAIVHCVQLDLTHDEAARLLGLPLGTLKSQVARGKARLREWLAPWKERGSA